MHKHVDRLVIFPRFTSFVQDPTVAHVVYSAPIDVRIYSGVIFTGWVGTGLGTTPATLTFTMETSVDLETWMPGTPFAPATPGTEVTSEQGFSFPWMRVAVTLSGANPGVSCWLLGEFVRREGLVAGRTA